MRLYSEINLNEQLDRLCLTPKQKDNVRYLIENIAYRYSKQIEKMECCGNCKHAVYSDSVVIDCYKDCKNLDKWELA